MNTQKTYNYQPPRGVAGALVDISPYSIDSRVNSEELVDAMRFGMGVVVGNNPGVDVQVPTDASTEADFEGIAMTSYTQQQTMTGEIHVYPAQTVGVLRWGRGWARVADGVTPVYNDPLFLIIDGDEAGFFTNDDGGGDNLPIKGRFYGPLGNGNIAPVELHNQLQQ